MIDDIQRTAVISSCGRFRPRLGRRWGAGPALVLLMLNPSKADSEKDDPTVMKGMRIASNHGYNALDVVNLFDYRATDPRELAAAGFPCGPHNDEAISDAAAGGRVVCLAYGAHAAHPAVDARVQVVLPLLRRRHAVLKALRITKGGFPQHPLYLPAVQAMHDFNEDAIAAAMHGAGA